MRSVATLLCVLALVAGCTSSAATMPGAPTKTAPTEPPATASPTPAPTPTPMPSATAISARVTFDGSKCVYSGPTVIPFPATLTIDYAPTPAQEGSFVGIFALRSGTTAADLNDPSNGDIGGSTPAFVYEDTHMFTQGAGRTEYRSVPSGGNPMAELGPDGKPYDTYAVVCIPALPGHPVGDTTLLRVIE
jgi:hypothetical protein